jgi:hypothetical protein
VAQGRTPEPRRCGNPTCGRDFIPHDARMKYCGDDCQDAFFNARRRRCKLAWCGAPIPADSHLRRFCSGEHRFEYLQLRRAGRVRVVPVRPEPIAVLLPKGCYPVQCIQVSDPAQVTRNVNCSQYERCLTFAESKRWRSFSCLRCPNGGAK